MSKVEKLKFDKFIEDICRREDLAKKNEEKRIQEDTDHPQRKYNKLYTERWQNSTRFIRGKK